MAMILGFRVFPSGDAMPDSLSAQLPVIAGQSVSLVAPTAPTGFHFIFWEANSMVQGQVDVTIPVPADGSDLAVSAWYLPVGAAADGVVKAWAFALDKGTVVPDSPFGAVAPVGASTGPNTVSTTSGHEVVVVTAARALAGNGLFERWLQSGDGIVAGDVLTVPAGGACVSVAFFALPDPDPCFRIRNELDSLNRSDFSSNRLFNEVRRNLAIQLKACAEENGELPW